ncbi:MAG: amidohydrolase [Anaerolineaceae bacterium]|nr:amidohydrolase [Anaerolineaceae bacterium]
MKQLSTYEDIRQAISELPVIDTHEHTISHLLAPEPKEPIANLVFDYTCDDLLSAGAGSLTGYFGDQDIPTETKWLKFIKYWKQIEFTGYALLTKRIMLDFYGEGEMTLDALQRIRARLIDQQDPEVYDRIIKEANIKCRLLDSLGTIRGEFTPLEGEILAGERELHHLDRFLIHLTEYHHMIQRWKTVQQMVRPSEVMIKTLDDYLVVCREKFQTLKQKGAVGIKDQSAYFRSLHFENAARSQAEPLFNRIIEDPRQSLGWPENKPLDDYLWHRFMEIAAELDLPVQLHTGHLADNTGIFRNDVTKANAILLTNTVEFHKDVRFDLLHGNWPYTGELLFLVKNYPNVYMNLTWLHIISPIAVRNLLNEAVGTIPHSKIIAFGGDHRDSAVHIAAHLSIALDNIAWALADQVDTGWIKSREAVQIAADWLFNNPNEFYKLGFEPVIL